MAEMWICGDCRSTNTARSSRCYRCRVPRATSEMTEATAANTFITQQPARTVLATAARLGVRYRPSWPIALLTGILILGTTGIDIMRTRQAMALILPDGTAVADPTRVQGILSLDLAWLIGYAASGILWSLWMALLVRNVPAVTGRWPKYGALGAFFALWIPIVSLRRPYSIVKEAARLLSGAALWPAVLIFAWWLAFMASFYLPTIVVLLRALGHDDKTLGASLSTGSTTRIALVIVAALLAALVLTSVEYYQRTALERREHVVLEPEPTRI